MKTLVLSLMIIPALLYGSPANAVPSIPWGVPKAVVVSPDGDLAYTVLILSLTEPSFPVAGATVEVRFNVVGDTLLCWCNDVPDPGLPPSTHSFFAVTDASGHATFHIKGGGCIERYNTAIPGPWDCAGEVFADGIKYQEFGTVSPDAVDNSGRLPTSTTSLWDPAGTCRTGLTDAVLHTMPLATSTYQWCTDIDVDNVCGIADAVILTPYMASAASCPGDGGATP